MTKTTPWDIQDYLQTPEECAMFVQAAIEDASDDAAYIAQVLGEVAKSKGMAVVARDAGLSREGLYKALGEGGNPSFATIVKVMGALGLKIAIKPVVPV